MNTGAGNLFSRLPSRLRKASTPTEIIGSEELKRGESRRCPHSLQQSPCFLSPRGSQTGMWLRISQAAKLILQSWIPPVKGLLSVCGLGTGIPISLTYKVSPALTLENCAVLKKIFKGTRHRRGTWSSEKYGEGFQNGIRMLVKFNAQC